MPADSPMRRARSQPGEPMDLANMRSLGVRSLAVTCFTCGHGAIIMPPAAERLRAALKRAGSFEKDRRQAIAHARPGWKRVSGTELEDMAWRILFASIA